MLLCVWAKSFLHIDFSRSWMRASVQESILTTIGSNYPSFLRKNNIGTDIDTLIPLNKPSLAYPG